MSDFNLAIKTVLKNEGGYSFDPKDAGGETKFGISKHSYPDLDIKNLTEREAVDIYYRDFWLANNYFAIENQYIAEQALDLAINVGSKIANKIIQIAYNFYAKCLTDCYILSIDGIIGNKTIDSLNHIETMGQNAILLVIIERIAAAYYVKLKKSYYTNGWLNRLFKNATLNPELF